MAPSPRTTASAIGDAGGTRTVPFVVVSISGPDAVERRNSGFPNQHVAIRPAAPAPQRDSRSASDPKRGGFSMVAAAALREENVVAAAAPSRSEVIARYRTLREISKRHHSKVLDFLSQDAIFHHGRRLWLLVGKMFVLDNMDDLNLAFDLAIHTAPMDRS